MNPSLHVLLTPAEIDHLRDRDLSRATCVVFDILRATTTMVTALANGAQALIPVEEIHEAIEWKTRQPDILLGGERNGMRIDASLTGCLDFDLGNSPAEYARHRVEGKTIVMTTTNGTRALRACRDAQVVYVGSFLNLRTTALRILQDPPETLYLVCSGTGDQPALEDVLAAGALCEKIWAPYSRTLPADGPEMARRLYGFLGANLYEAMLSTSNGRRLLSLPNLREDVARCVQRETAPLVAIMDHQGVVRAE